MHAPLTTTAIRALLVHDDDRVGLAMASALAVLGQRIVVEEVASLSAADAAGAVATADVVILPPTADAELLRSLNTPEGPAVLLWSAEPDPDLEIHVLGAGLAGTLPMGSPALLESALERAVAWQRRLRRARQRQGAEAEPKLTEWVFDAGTKRLFVNAGHTLDVSRDDVRNLLQQEVIAQIARGAQTFQQRHELDGPDGRVEISVHGAVKRGASGHPALRGHVSTRPKNDIGFSRSADALTGLPNRETFLAHVREAHRRLASEGREFAVIVVDLDGMHGINDGLGHEAGDLMLRWAGDRIGGLLPDRIVARVGSDEFAVLLVSEDESPEAVGRRIVAALTGPVSLGADLVYAGAHAGTAKATDTAGLPEATFRDAHAALERARSAKHVRLVPFTDELRAQQRNRLQLDRDLRTALQARAFEVHFQPIVRLADATVLGFEALLRWRHPERGLVSPAEFIPLAERNGLIVPIGRWVLEQACAALRGLQEARPELASTYVTVNVSPTQFQATDVEREVRSALRGANLEPNRLRLEVTEASALSDADGVIAVLQSLREAGIQILIDDFGTGYSALQYLARMPADALKVDKSFVEGLGQDGRKTRVVSTIADLAESLGLKLVAEGIETQDQLAWLRRLGINEGQGYLFAKPASPADILRMFARGDRD